MTLSEGIQRYIDYMTVDREFSRKTVENRTKTLQNFLAVVGDAMPDEAAIRTYRRWMLSQSLKVVTRSTYLITVKNFIKFLNARNWCEFSYLMIEIPKVPLPDKPWLTEADVRKMVDAIPGNTIIGLRDKAILAVVFSSGIRASKCVSLTEDSFNAEGAGSVVGKGKKRRPIFASRWAVSHLQTYLATKHQLRPKNATQSDIEHSRPMFDGYRRLTIGGGRWQWVPCSFSAHAFTKVVRRNALKYLGRRLSAHSLRHSFATDKLNKGMDIRYLQGLMGHSDITSTQHYTHYADGKLRELHEAYSEDTRTTRYEQRENHHTMLRIEITEFPGNGGGYMEKIQAFLAALGIDKMK